MSAEHPSLTAVRLTLPDFGRRKFRTVVARDGRSILLRRALIRAAAMSLRPINLIALAASFLVMLAGQAAGAAIPAIVLFGLFVLVLERGAEPPKRTRAARIVRDVRPLLLRNAIETPETKRVGRIVRADPDFVIPPLPPERPRTRVAERRPGPDEPFL